MREHSLKVKNRLPIADQEKKIARKVKPMHIYIGPPMATYASSGTSDMIQLNDQLVPVEAIKPYVLEAMSSENESDRVQFVASLKVDKNVKMGLVKDVKAALQEVGVRRINYATAGQKQNGY